MKTLLLTLCLLPILVACGPKTLVVLTPDDDGKVGRVAVATSSTEVVLTNADEYAEVTDSAITVKHMDRKAEQDVFGPALAAQPPKPASFMLFFMTDSAVPERASKETLPDIVRTIQGWNHPQVSVIGHTDTMGDRNYNYRLSAARAESVRKLLEQSGVAPGAIRVFAYGESDPLVSTGSNVSEHRNRRVEVFVR